jgi:glyoxylate reductase
VVPKVVCSAALPIALPPLLGAVDLVIPDSGGMTRERLLAEAHDADALIVLLDVAVDSELLARASRLRIVANHAVGYDNVDVAACTKRGIVVTNTPDVLTDATADFTFALLLAAARRVVEGDRLVRTGTWTGWAPGQLLGLDVSGQTLGIVGLGRIGRAVARRARGFDMQILYSGRRDATGAPQLQAQRVALDDLLARSDFVTLHCPLTAETQNLIDREALSAMKPTAVLVNTARGGCVDERALAAALDSGQIAAAGLDVFADEPAISPAIVASERVVLAPHAGSATTTARTRMGQICARAVRAVLDGDRPPTVINPEAYQ